MIRMEGVGAQLPTSPCIEKIDISRGVQGAQPPL